ncbi:MAG TPA: nucleoside-diphosphate kinase [Candidatus Baltobacteraceae bacterium]|nr:nucleoside-diphosphate kinase [Candidatus Baltobacteraceae bacterium]
MIERTLVILKPDAIENGSFAAINAAIASLGLVVRKFVIVIPHLPEETVRTLYAAYVDQPFFPRILAYMTRGLCAATVWEGEDAVAKVRTLAGATRPDQADPASLRARFGRITEDGGIENALHCSATTD